MQLRDAVGSLGSFASRYQRDLGRLGIDTVEDLLLTFPFRYEDFSVVRTIAGMQGGVPCTVKGKIAAIDGFQTPKKKVFLVRATLSDETGTCALTWFGQRYILESLRAGMEVVVSGTPERTENALGFVSPAWEAAEGARVHVGRMVPVHAVSGAMTTRVMRTLVNRTLAAADALPALVPEDVTSRLHLLPRPVMVRALQFPESFDALQAAEHTRDFEQLFLLAIAQAVLVAERERLTAPAMPFNQTVVRDFVQSLPFTLTNGQRAAAWQILQDMEKVVPMNRLLDGDVGSGKTVVGTIAAVHAAAAGFQTAFLVPTSVLAEQHFTTVTRLVGKGGARVGLWTGGGAKLVVKGESVAKTPAEMADLLASGDVDVIVGTHALLEDAVAFSRLGFVIVDEQHRFGVTQRKKLSEKAGALSPHVLCMTATPIPRTLALTAYGDLSLSRLAERPKGRKPVATRVLGAKSAEIIAAALSDRAARGEQSFVVCPRIEESEKKEEFVKRTVTETIAELQAALPHLRIIAVHGKMKPQEKEEAMRQFAAKEADVLVATTVIEVGVDVPNATLMVIYDAMLFGLAQLHQLRGRVGRGEKPGECLLVSERTSREAFARLRLLERSDDGWALAEADLRARGPGEMIGTTQTGWGDLSFRALRDEGLFASAKTEAAACLAADPALEKLPALKKEINSRLQGVSLT